MPCRGYRDDTFGGLERGYRTRVQDGVGTPQVTNELLGMDERASTHGPRLSEVSNAMVQLHRRFYGRGPTRARTVFGGDIVTTVMSDIFTTVEKTLVERGRGDEVAGVRRAFQDAMRDEFVGAIEQITGRRVIGFASAVDVQAGIATETFVLAPRRDDGGTSPGGDELARQADPEQRRAVRADAREAREQAGAVRAEARQAARRSQTLRPPRPD